MRTVLVFITSLLAVAHGDRNSSYARFNGRNGWYIPQSTGGFKWMSKEEVKIAHENFQKSGETIVDYFLYTRDNPKIEQQIDSSPDSIRSSNFNPQLRTYFVVHGWKGDLVKGVYGDQLMRTAWLEKEPCNVIIVDWSSRALIPSYHGVYEYVPDVGKILAEYIDFLNATAGLPINNVTIVGHSFGAQVAGYTGRNVRNGQIHTIIGLDPAYPMYEYDDKENILNPSDAFYVETIQTNGDLLAYLKPLGTASFYPNGGMYQPGCGDDYMGMCSHFRAEEFFVEAIVADSFLSIMCPDFVKAMNNKCGNNFSTVRMGNPSNAGVAKGVYYVPVSDRLPFGLSPHL